MRQLLRMWKLHGRKLRVWRRMRRLRYAVSYRNTTRDDNAKAKSQQASIV